MKMKFVGMLFLVTLLSSCVPMNTAQSRRRRPAPPAPCTTPVHPIQYSSLVVFINYNFSYTPKDSTAARPWLRSDILNRLNEDGKADGNTFSESNGTAINFTITYTLNNDGQDHFTGSINLSGWGQGNIATLYSGQYSYTNAADLTRDLTDKAYGYIHGGWHDSRPNCPQY